MDYQIIFVSILAVTLSSVHAQNNDNVPGWTGTECESKQKIWTPYPCTTTEKLEACEFVFTPVNKLCQKYEQVEIPFDCPTSLNEYKDKCIKVPVDNDKTCDFSVKVFHPSYCIKKVKKKICGFASLPVQEECMIPVDYLQSFECDGYEITKKCSLERKKVGEKMCLVNSYSALNLGLPFNNIVVVTSRKLPHKKGYCRRVESSMKYEVCSRVFEQSLCYETYKVGEEPCEKEVIVEEPFDCNVMVEKRGSKCSKMVTKTVLVKNAKCSSLRWKMSKKHSNSFPPTKSGCASVIKLQYQVMEDDTCDSFTSVPKLCFKQNVKTIKTTCPTKVTTQECVTAPFEITNNCYIIPVNESSVVECPDQKEEELTTHYFKEINLIKNALLDQQEPIHCPIYDFTETCTEMKTPIKQECYVKMRESRPSQCQRIELQEVCEEKEVEELVPCIEEASVNYKDHCSGPVWVEKCGNGPTNPSGKCSAQIKQLKTYECTENLPTSTKCEDISFQVEATCLKEEILPFTSKCYNHFFGDSEFAGRYH